MDTEAKKLIKAATRANQRRRNWTNILDDVWDFCFPMRQGFYNEADGQERMERIFDETPIDAVAEFSSIIMEGLFSGRWFRLKPGSEVPEDQKMAVQAELDIINKYIYELLDQSNLESEGYEAIQEMAASVGNLLIKEGTLNEPLLFQSVSMIHLDYDIDAAGRIDTVYRTRKISAGDVQTEYPDGNFSSNMMSMIQRQPAKKLTFIECTKRDWEEVGTETHDYKVVCKDTSEMIFKDAIKGDGSRPWVNFRWSADSGQAYGRGPLITCLPSIRNLNLVKEMGLENAQLHIGGIFQADDDGTYNFDNIEIVPMSVMSRTPGSKGLDPVQLPGNPDMTQFVIQDLQNAIRMILLNNEFGSLEKTPRSAEETYQRSGKQMRKIRAPLKRLVTELVLPVAKRIVHVLRDSGRIELPKIDGKAISVVARGPLVRMMDALENEDLLEFVSIVKNTYGPESKLYIHDDKFVDHLAKNKEIPQDILVTGTERELMMEEMQARMQQQQQQQQPQPGQPGQPPVPETIQ